MKSAASSSFLIAMVVALFSVVPSAQAADKAWDQILNPQPPKLPPPRTALQTTVELPTHRQAMAKTAIQWETDMQAALKIAQKENRPIFVTFRCLPCKSCSEFDKTVLEGGPDLNPLFLQFVTVRLTSTNDVDHRILPMAQFQDMDVSWWSWFLSPEGKVYGVFGGRDASGDQTRTSKQALIKTMNRVLAHHYDPRRPQWDVDGPAPQTEGKPASTVGMPGFANWLKIRRNNEQFTKQNCVHCHQAREILWQGDVDAGTFDKNRDVWVWPFPENVGVTLDVNDGLLVKQVQEGSPAAKAGIKAGDALGAAGDRALFSQADFRGVLHRAPLTGATKLDVRWLRDGAVLSGALDLPDGWRKSDISWRASLAEGNVGAFAGFWPQALPDPQRQRLEIPAGKLAIKPYIGQQKSAAVRAGLKGDDVIVAVNGESPNISNRAFTVWFRMKFEPGQDVTLTVMNPKGEKRDIKFKAEQ